MDEHRSILWPVTVKFVNDESRKQKLQGEREREGRREREKTLQPSHQQHWKPGGTEAVPSKFGREMTSVLEFSTRPNHQPSMKTE